MNRSLLPLAAATLLAFAVAAPAGALTREGITATLVAPKAATIAGKTSSTAKTHTCQAGDTKEKAKARTSMVGGAKKPAVVACEQPPRSELLGSGLRQAAATALAALG